MERANREVCMPDKPSIATHLSADLPIRGREEDKLNRTGFADALAHVIRSWRNKPSLVIGLFGDWGSGKSSLKNLVLESIRQRGEDSIHVVEFSPWQVSSQEMLSVTFFREIGAALSKTSPADEASSRGGLRAGRCTPIFCPWQQRWLGLSVLPCRPLRHTALGSLQ